MHEYTNLGADINMKYSTTTTSSTSYHHHDDMLHTRSSSRSNNNVVGGGGIVGGGGAHHHGNHHHHQSSAVPARHSTIPHAASDSLMSSSVSHSIYAHDVDGISGGHLLGRISSQQQQISSAESLHQHQHQHEYTTNSNHPMVISSQEDCVVGDISSQQHLRRAASVPATVHPTNINAGLVSCSPSDLMGGGHHSTHLGGGVNNNYCTSDYINYAPAAAAAATADVVNTGNINPGVAAVGPQTGTSRVNKNYDHLMGTTTSSMGCDYHASVADINNSVASHHHTSHGGGGVSNNIHGNKYISGNASTSTQQQQHLSTRHHETTSLYTSTTSATTSGTTTFEEKNSRRGEEESVLQKRSSAHLVRANSSMSTHHQVQQTQLRRSGSSNNSTTKPAEAAVVARSINGGHHLVDGASQQALENTAQTEAALAHTSDVLAASKHAKAGVRTEQLNKRQDQLKQSTSSSSGEPRPAGNSSHHQPRSTGLENWKNPDRYHVMKVIGSGSYGQVCQAYDKRSERNVAIKRIKRIFEDLIDCKRLLREIAILGDLKDDRVVRLYDVCVPDDVANFTELYLVLELCDSDFKKLFKLPEFLTESHIITLLFNTLCGLKYIHSAGIYHRDLKPANCLVNRDCAVKICDFGLSRPVDASSGVCRPGPDDTRDILDEDGSSVGSGSNRRFPRRALTGHVVTRWYRAPELILLQEHYTEQIDVWSLGCIFAELLGMIRENYPNPRERCPLFQGSTCYPLSPHREQDRDYQYYYGRSSRDQLNVIFNILGTPSDDVIEKLDKEYSFFRTF